jgi:hypothetical protein
MAKTKTRRRRNFWRAPLEVRQEIWRLTGYTPTPAALVAHEDLSRIKLFAGGERGSKSYSSANGELVVWIALNPTDLFWIVGPDYEQCHAEFEYTVDALTKIGILDEYSVSMPKSGSWSLRTLLGGQLVTKTSADVLKLASVAPAGILMAEAAQQPYLAFLRLRGRVAEKRGPLLLSGTFESSLGWYADLFKSYQGENLDGGRSFSLPTWSNIYIYPGGRDDPEIKALEAMYPPDVFMERFGGVPCPPATLVFKEFSYAAHVTERAEHTPGNPVQLWIDPGYAGAYAVLAVEISRSVGEVWHFDELYYSGRTAQEIIAEAKARSWWCDVRGLVMDVAGRQHPAAESQAEIWYSLTGLRVTMQPVPIVDGILRHRTFLKDPATGRPRLFHHPRCGGTLREYGLYKYAEDSEHRPQTEIPIDRDNHAMKALAYGLVANFGHVAPARRQRIRVRYG